jgi:ATP-dependent DNA ligase
VFAALARPTGPDRARRARHRGGWQIEAPQHALEALPAAAPAAGVGEAQQGSGGAGMKGAAPRSRRGLAIRADLPYDLSVPLRFIAPCLPSPAEKPPSGPAWLHEIKHDGFRMMARRDAAG